MTVNSTVIHVKGRPVWVPSSQIAGRDVVSTGNWLKIATLKDEDLIEGEAVPDPQSFVSRLKRNWAICRYFQLCPEIA